MTELVRRDDAPVSVAEPSPSSLYLWARDAQDAYVIAQKLANTAFVADSLRGKPAEITGAILTGHEIGLQPMAAVRSIDIIKGIPAMRALALRGLVQSRGHDVWVESSSEARAVVCGRRAGSEHTQRSTWTMDRARRLGLAVDDPKGPWRRQPEAMLVARATAEVCRLVAADVLLGLPYAVEEVEAEAGNTDNVPAPVRVRRSTPRTRPEVATPEPELDEPGIDGGLGGPVGPQSGDVPQPGSVSPAQLRMLHALFGRAGITERSARLGYVSTTLGRPVGSSSDLTSAEASRVIDALTAALPQDDEHVEEDP